MNFFFLILSFFLCLPGFGQEDYEGESEIDDQVEIEVEAPRKKTPRIILPVFDAATELQKLGYESINAKALTDKRVIELIKRMLEESTIDQVPGEVVKGLINEKLKDSFLGNFLKSNPRLFDLLVDLMRDKRALMGLVDILLKREDLKSYLHFWIAFLIAAWLLKKALFKKAWGPWKTFGMGLLVSFVITSVSVTIFYNTFKKELTPALEIISHHWNRKT